MHWERIPFGPTSHLKMRPTASAFIVLLAATKECPDQWFVSLQDLHEAGLTHVHLLPSYDYGSVPERKENQKVPEVKPFKEMMLFLVHQFCSSARLNLDLHSWFSIPIGVEPKEFLCLSFSHKLGFWINTTCCTFRHQYIRYMPSLRSLLFCLLHKSLANSTWLSISCSSSNVTGTRLV